MKARSARVLGAIWLLFGLAVAAATPALPHALQPGFLEIREVGQETYAIGWKVPQVSGRPMAIEAALPANCEHPGPPALSFTGSAYSAVWTTACKGGMLGREIRINGLERTSTDVLVRFEQTGRAPQTVRFTPDAPSQTLKADPGLWDVVSTYFLLGVDHILTGVDHILFVLALVLLVKGTWRLVKTVTAFTVAHSITLSAAALGLVNIPGPPVEAIIALSILFLAGELATRDPERPGLSERKPWLVAMVFGLVHGLGFAGALSETGLPSNEIPAALLTFNLGVETGQLMFIGAVLALRAAGRRVLANSASAEPVLGTCMTLTVYGLGGVSAFWLIERVSGFFG